MQAGPFACALTAATSLVVLAKSQTYMPLHKIPDFQEMDSDYMSKSDDAVDHRFYRRYSIREVSEKGHKRIIRIVSRTHKNVWYAEAIVYRYINKTGWNFIEIVTSDCFDDSEQAYHAGVVEGYETADLVYEFWYNVMRLYCVGKEKVCEKIKEFLLENKRWIDSQVETQGPNSTYWYKVGLFYNQIDGLHVGLQLKRLELEYIDLLMMNALPDLPDLEDKFNFELGLKRGLPRRLKLYNGCLSASFIKLLPLNRNLYVGHNTFASYSNMVRMQKRYTFYFRMLPTTDGTLGKYTSVSFTGYPGLISSADDFYMTSMDLAITRSTIGNNNDQLWKFVQPNTLLSGTRAMVTNRLANIGKNWAHTFGMYNSGTANSQWVVVDYKKYVKNASVKGGCLWVVDQIPGLMESRDLTSIFRKQKYWASYNIPFFRSVAQLSGTFDLERNYGNWFSWVKAPRGELFKSYHTQVSSVQRMLMLMGNNNFKFEEKSRCAGCTPAQNAALAIAPRNDLNPPRGLYIFPFLDHSLYGAIDLKMTTCKLVKALQCIAAAGPPTNYGRFPPFTWSEAAEDEAHPHIGQPKKFNFKAVLKDWEHWNISRL